jgi:hypothetical protein
MESTKSAELLSAELGGCIEFPLEAMPKILRPLIREGAEAMQCPPDYIGVPLLTNCGAVLGRSHVIEVKPGWRESSALWTAVVGKTGTTKSPAHNLATEGIQWIQSEWLDEFTQGYAMYNRNDKEGEEPSLKRIMVSDTTVEALGVVMKDNPRGVILVRDEMSGWMTSMNQYKGGKGSDYQFYLTAWSGGACQIDRKNLEAPIIIPHTYLAVSGSVTPGVLSELLGREHQIDGFAARLLISYPQEVDEQWTDKGVKDSTIKHVIELQRKLSVLGFKADTKCEPNVVRFSKKGYEAFKEVMKDHLEQKKRYKLNDSLLAHWSKMQGYTARLSLIIHMVRLYSGEISNKSVDPETVYMAATLVDYFKAHIAKFYKELKQIQIVALYERILQWAHKKNKSEILTREIYTARIISNADTTRAVLNGMAEQGLGKWKDAESKQIFVLSPTQHSATQQNQSQWEMPVVGDNNKWLNRLRKLRKR